MNDIIIRFIACFIINKEARRKFRSKYMMKNKFEAITNELSTINNKIYGLTNCMNSMLDISTAPKAKGILRAIQLQSFEMLKELDVVFKRNNIDYWLDFGTLIGAVRHGGFVPWDDDIDISMMAEDFKKFCSIAEKELKGTRCVLKKAPCNIGKVLHIEFLPKTSSEWLDFFLWRLKKKVVFAVDIFPYYRSNKTEVEIKECMSFGKQKKRELLSKANSFEELEEAAKIVKNTQQPLISKNGKNLFLGLETIAYTQPCVHNFDDIFPLKTMMFEGGAFPVPNKPNKVLQTVYGDYNSFPFFSRSHVNLFDLDGDQMDKLEKYICVQPTGE